jgi:tetratricopeptide (TPR) repeat protein
MDEVTAKADDIVNEHSMLDLKADSLRMLGRVADYKKDFTQSKTYYEQILEIYRNSNSPRTMEIKSFLAATLINLGNTDEGLGLARSTFDEFENSEMKQRDYFTWAIWKSGLWPRIIKILVEKNVVFDREEMKKYLDASEEILKNPEGEITWGDKKFEFRVNEISEARALLNQTQ